MPCSVAFWVTHNPSGANLSVPTLKDEAVFLIAVAGVWVLYDVRTDCLVEGSKMVKTPVCPCGVWGFGGRNLFADCVGVENDVAHFSTQPIFRRFLASFFISGLSLISFQSGLNCFLVRFLFFMPLNNGRPLRQLLNWVTLYLCVGLWRLDFPKAILAKAPFSVWRCLGYWIDDLGKGHGHLAGLTRQVHANLNSPYGINAILLGEVGIELHDFLGKLIVYANNLRSFPHSLKRSESALWVVRLWDGWRRNAEGWVFASPAVLHIKVQYGSLLEEDCKDLVVIHARIRHQKGQALALWGHNPDFRL